MSASPSVVAAVACSTFHCTWHTFRCQSNSIHCRSWCLGQAAREQRKTISCFNESALQHNKQTDSKQTENGQLFPLTRFSSWFPNMLWQQLQQHGVAFCTSTGTGTGTGTGSTAAVEFLFLLAAFEFLFLSSPSEYCSMFPAILLYTFGTCSYLLLLVSVLLVLSV